MTLAAARGFLAAEPAQARPVERDDLTADSLLRFARDVAGRVLGRPAAPMDHLRPIAERMMAQLRAVIEGSPPVRFTAHAAVQHGKSTLVQAFVLMCLRLVPWIRIGYPSYAAGIAEDKMWICRDLAESFGVRVHPDYDKREKWRVIGGGFVQAGGLIGGSWTGSGYEILLLDDLYKGQGEAESGAYRAKVEGAFHSQIETRGAERLNIGVIMARWHPRDFSAVMIGRWGRSCYVCLPALDERGCEACAARAVRRAEVAEHTCRPLAPSFLSLQRILELRDGGVSAAGERIEPLPRKYWHSLYQGSPQVEGAKIFDASNLTTYERLPEAPSVEALGIDAAYGAKRQHDRSSIVAWRRYLSEPRVLWLVEAWIGHEPLELFACRVAEVSIRRAGGPRLRLPRSAAEIETLWREQLRREEVLRARRLPARWYGSSSEVGAASLFAGYGAPVRGVSAAVDKKARADGWHVGPMVGGYTSAWSERRIRWPLVESEHVARLRAEHELFTGGDGEDDGVDAAVAGHDDIAVPARPGTAGGGFVLVGPSEGAIEA